MNTGGTLLIEALLERLGAAQAKALLDQLDKSLAQHDSGLPPEQTGSGRRRSDTARTQIAENPTSKTLKD